MNARRQATFVTAALILLAAPLAGTTGRSTAATATAGTHGARDAQAGRLVAFRSCGELLRYAKSQAARFVGPWGLGTGAGKLGPPVPVASGSRRDSSPQQG